MFPIIDIIRGNTFTSWEGEDGVKVVVTGPSGKEEEAEEESALIDFIGEVAWWKEEEGLLLLLLLLLLLAFGENVRVSPASAQLTAVESKSFP